MNEIKQFFGQNLKRIRTERGYTQEKLAECIGVNQRQLTRIETGRSFPSFATLDKLCDTLDIPANVLFDFSEYCELCKTGTDNRFQYYVSRVEDNIVYVSKPSYTEKEDASDYAPEDCDTTNNDCYSNSENRMWEIAKNTQKPIIVDYLQNDVLLERITYNPDRTAKIEVQTSSNNTNINEIIHFICLLQTSTTKLNFIKLAIKCLEDKSSIGKMQNVLEGMLI